MVYLLGIDDEFFRIQNLGIQGLSFTNRAARYSIIWLMMKILLVLRVDYQVQVLLYWGWVELKRTSLLFGTISICWTSEIFWTEDLRYTRDFWWRSFLCNEMSIILLSCSRRRSFTIRWRNGKGWNNFWRTNMEKLIGFSVILFLINRFLS